VELEPGVHAGDDQLGVVVKRPWRCHDAYMPPSRCMTNSARYFASRPPPTPCRFSSTTGRRNIATARQRASSPPVKKSIYRLIDLREILCGCNRLYLEHLSALDDFSAGVRALDRLTKPRKVEDKTVKGTNFFDPVVNAAAARIAGPASEHRRDPASRLASAGRTTLARSYFTPASPAARHRCDQAGDGNLPLLPYPNWPQCHSSTLPRDPEHPHSGPDLMGFLMHEVPRVG
jgi:hypothetical protein